MSTSYDVIRRPVITEKGLTLKENDRTLCFEVSNRASKTQIQEAIERIFKVKVEHVRTMNVPGKERRRGRYHRLPPGLEEGVCHASRRRKDDRVRGELLMGIKTFRPKTHSLRFKTVLDYKQELTTDEPLQAAAGAQELGSMAETTTVRLRFAIAAAETRSITASSISSATSRTFPPRSKRSNTIRTVPPSSLC